MIEKIQVPITFNAHKHHFQFLLQRIEIWKTIEWQHVEQELTGIGENLIDLYTGDLTIANIGTECIHFFKNLNINNKTSLTAWLHPLEYRKIELSDFSQWVIKEGNDTVRFIHIHPAKQSPHTIRVRAATLKTVIALMVCTGNISDRMTENLQTVNHIRKTNLHLSPIKSQQSGKGILQLWELFYCHYVAKLPFN